VGKSEDSIPDSVCEGYIKAFGGHPAKRVMLTEKGLAAMKAVPAGLKDSLAAELRKATEHGAFNTSSIGELLSRRQRGNEFGRIGSPLPLSICS
jgi:hypothetical protein